MTPLQIELTRLIGKKELDFWCRCKTKWEYEEDIVLCSYWKTVEWCKRNKSSSLEVDDIIDEIIGHPPTLSDLHRFMNENGMVWNMDKRIIYIDLSDLTVLEPIWYNSSKYLLDQETSTLEQIISLISSNQ